MAAELSAKRRGKLTRTLGIQCLPDVKEGPIRTLVEQESFDETHLLSNYPAFLGQWYAQWLPREAKVHQVEIANPTDYASVFRAADAVLGEITAAKSPSTPELCVHLSPGTPVMTAIWVLLGKSRYSATFYQTHGGRSWETELFARAIHEASHRRTGPFVAINCAAIPRDLLESELFGHKKGAFTGATEDRVGAIQHVHGGTMFLDEIGECDPGMQSKLLRVLQPGA